MSERSMGNSDHLRFLRLGVEAWNLWRRRNPEVRPDLSDAVLSHSDLGWVDLRNAHLERARLEFCSLRSANLEGASGPHISLRGSILHSANLRSANLDRADLTNVHLVDGYGRSRADVCDATFLGATFTTEGNSSAEGSFLDLSLCEGLFDARFGDSSFLPTYLDQAHRYATRSDIPELRIYPILVQEAAQRLGRLTQILAVDRPPQELISVTDALNAELIKYLKRNPHALHALRPRQFELLVAEMLAGFGWRVHVASKSLEGGYDLFGISSDASGVESSWVVECRRIPREERVGVEVVRALYAVKSELRASGAMLATTSLVTDGVERFKASRYDLDIRDQHSMIDWINEYQPHPTGRLYLRNNELVMPE